jgi:hypothetical protein
VRPRLDGGGAITTAVAVVMGSDGARSGASVQKLRRSHGRRGEQGLRVLAGVMVGFAAAACSGADRIDLGPQPGCTKTPLSATLHLDATDPRYVWATSRSTGMAIELRLPSDDSLIIREGPPTVLLWNDAVVGRDGDIVLAGCRDVVTGAYFIRREDLAPAR